MLVQRPFEALCGFGQVSYESSPSNGDDFKYVAKRVDPDTGLQRHGSSWYNPATGDWISADPDDSANPKVARYAGNNPTNVVDSGETDSTDSGDAVVWLLEHGVIGDVGKDLQPLQDAMAAKAAHRGSPGRRPAARPDLRLPAAAVMILVPYPLTGRLGPREGCSAMAPLGGRGGSLPRNFG